MVNKKNISITGSLALPLKTGAKAVIFHSGGLIRTSPVESINQIAEGYISFETRDSVYCVEPSTPPEPAANAMFAYCA